MLKKSFAILLFGAVLLAACAPTSYGPSGAVNSLAVTGTGQVSVAPDIAYISIGVHTESSDVGVAVANNAREVDNVMAALQAAGVAAEDMQTTNFSVYSYQDYDFEGQPTGQVYSVDNTVYVTVRTLASMGDLLDSAVSAGANSIWGIQFDVADRSEAIAEARSAAVEDAMAEAESMAELTGVTLGDLVSVSYSTGNTYDPYYGYGMGGGGGAAAETSTTIVPGQITVTVNVYLSYAIR